MNENPEGTPNPLNPAPGTENEMAAGTGPDFVETPPEPEMENTPEVPEAPVVPEAQEAVEVQEVSVSVGPTSDDFAFAEEPKAAEEPKPPMSSRISDPMMRPVSHNNFDTLAMEDTKEEEAPVMPGPETSLTAAPVSDEPELVPKNSIVEPAHGSGKKKGLIIGAIIFLIIAVICGAAAIAILLLNGNGGDRVEKAIEKVLNGGVPNIISAQGSISSVSNVDDADGGAFDIDFNGTLDVKSGINSVSAKVNAEMAGGIKATISVDELRDGEGNTFFKVRGLDSLIPSTEPVLTADASEDATVNLVTDCMNSGEDTNCLTGAEPDVASSVLSAYSGLFSVINDQWILTSDDFTSNMNGLDLFDNSTTCLINAFGTLPKYSSDLATKYKANQFLTYSTDKLEISKKRDALYKIGIDTAKLTAFVNSLSNNGFINELNACAGDTATNDTVTSQMVDGILANLPTIYVEVDSNYNFTRVYFRVNTGDETNSTTTTADLLLSYPAKLEIETPEEYVDMSTLVNNLLTNMFNISE